MKAFLVITLFSLLSINMLYGQTTLPVTYRGSSDAISRGVLDGNGFHSNYRNHGEMARWGDLPMGEWADVRCDRFDSNCTSTPAYTFFNGIGFVLAAQVTGEREKWSYYYGEAVSDTTLNPVIINYREAGVRISPYSGEIWGWTPVNGFHNPDRVDPVSGTRISKPAISTDETSWPEIWPDKLNETDAGWAGSWNGFLGKGTVTGALESLYVMDDYSDHEYSIGLETEGPHSEKGVYIPSPSDSTIGGLGTQVEVRHFQFDDVLSNDLVFSHYRITNASERDLEKVWASFIMDMPLDMDNGRTVYKYVPEHHLIIKTDDGSADLQYGYMGIMLLEHSKSESNGIDEDNDGIIDESKFNGPGVFIEGKAAIDEYLNANYNMVRFNQVHVDLEDFPAYRNERWWTGDEDMDWIAFDDLNQNGIQDNGEPIEHDLGRDGLGPADSNYPGLDEGEGDGIPTQGEPNFGERDMLEAERLDNRGIDFSTRPFYESGDNLRNDNWLFDRILNSATNADLELETNEAEPFFLTGFGPFSLEQNTSAYVIKVLLFAKTEEELLGRVTLARNIYESDFGQARLLTPAEIETQAPAKVSLSQNYPNPFNPSTTIQFSLNSSEKVTLSIFDITGRKIKDLISGKNYSSGNHSVDFDASALSSGLYLYRLQAGEQIMTKKLTLIK